VLDLIDALRAEVGYGLVMATHDPNVAARCGRIVEINDGRITAENAR
jgi:putative ABC transport system ATP-binding protein